MDTFGLDYTELLTPTPTAVSKGISVYINKFLHMNLYRKNSSYTLRSIIYFPRNVIMSLLKFWFCLLVLVVVVSSSDSRLLPPTLPVQSNDKLIEQAQEIIRARMQRDGLSASFYAVSDRYSPGGPDPHHH